MLLFTCSRKIFNSLKPLVKRPNSPLPLLFLSFHRPGEKENPLFR